MSDEIVARNRLRLLPPIRRSRQWRLYAEDGRRFLRMTFAKEPEANLRLGAARLGAFFAREAGTRTA